MVVEETFALPGGLLVPTGTRFMSMGYENDSENDAVSNIIVELAPDEGQSVDVHIFVPCKILKLRNEIHCEIKYFARDLRG